MEEDFNLLLPQEPRKYDLGEGTTLLDADTATFTTPEGEQESLRLAGANAYETSKVDPETGFITQGEVGGQLQHNLLSTLGQGYSQVVTEGNRDAHGRLLGDLYNPEENKFLTNEALYHGVLRPSTFSNESQTDLYYLGEAEKKLRTQEGKLNKWDLAAEMLQGERSDAPLKAKEYAATAADYAANPDRYLLPGTQLEGRNINNEAEDWFWSDLQFGGRSVVSGFIGGADLFADFFSDDPNAIDYVLRSREIHDSFGPNRQHLNPFDAKGNWKLDSVSDYGKFFLGNFAVSAPYMGVLLASAINPFTAYTVPTMLYAGEVYNEQEEKDQGKALITGLGMAALDKLGLDAIMGKFGPRLLSDAAAQQTVVRELMKSKGISQASAQNMLTQGIKRELASFSRSYKDLVKGQLAKSAIAKNTAAKVGVATVGESVTEIGQELLQAWGNGQIHDMTESEINQLMITAGLASAGIGGAISTVGSVVDTLGTYDAVKSANETYRRQFEDVENQKLDRLDQQETGQGDGGHSVRTKAQVLTDLDAEADGEGIDFDASLQEQAEKRDEGSFGGLKFWEYYRKRGLLGATFQGGLDSLYNHFGKRGRVLRGLFNGFLDTRNGNVGPDGQKNTRIRSDMINTEAGSVEADHARFGMDSQAISDVLYDEQNVAVWKRLAAIFDNPNNPYSSWREAFDAEGLSVTPEAQAQLEAFLEKAEAVESASRLAAQTEDKGYAPGSFWDYNTYDQGLVDAQNKELSRIFAAELNEDQAEVAEILEELALDEFDLLGDVDIDITTPLDAESLLDTKTTPKESSLKQKIKQKLLTDPQFAHLRTKNVHTLMHKRAHGAALTNTNKNFYDLNKGTRIARILQLAHKKGEINDVELAYLSKEFLDQFEIFRGTYKQDTMPRWAKATQNFFMFWSTISVLPLATVASFPEVGVALGGLPPKQQWAMFKDLAKGMAVEAKEYMVTVADAPARTTGYSKRVRFNKAAGFQNAALTETLGYHDNKQSAQARLHGGTDLGFLPWQQIALTAFFKGTLLTNWTNGLRTAVAGSAADTLWGWIDEVSINGTTTEYGREAAGMLAELGVDVELLAGINKEDTSEILLRTGKHERTDIERDLEVQLRSALINFVDHRVVMPSKTNRPKLYYDPRFRMFTHLTGYVATLTSVVLPKLYKNIVRGTPGLSYGAFVTIASMFILGWASQWLKDELKYGDSSRG